MNKRAINKLKTKFLNLFSNKLNKKTSESPQIIDKKIQYNKFGYPIYVNKNERNLKK